MGLAIADWIVEKHHETIEVISEPGKGASFEIVIPTIFIFTEDIIFPYSVRVWIFVIALAVVSQVLGQVFIAYSIKKFSSEFVALVLLLESVLAGIAAWVIFGEILSLYDWISLFVILLGLYIALSSQSAIKE